MDVHFSSEKDDWETPQDLFDLLDKKFHFTLDVCATEENAKCDRFYTENYNGLEQKWSGDISWCNPPYGREIGRWMEKAYFTGAAGGLVVCLVPARTDTNWWWQYCTVADEIRFLKGRLKFGGHKNSAPFPSAVVIFHDRMGRWNRFEKAPLITSWWDWKAELEWYTYDN